MADEHFFANDEDLGDTLGAAVQAIRAEPISNDVLERVKRQLLVQVPREPVVRLSQRIDTRRSLRHRMKAISVVLVGCLILTIGLCSLVIPGPRLTFAQVQSALAKQKWVLLRYEDGEEYWVSLLDGRRYLKEPTGRVQYFGRGIWQQYIPPETNRLAFPNESGITESRATAETMNAIPKWTPQSAWQFLMGQFEQTAEAKQSRNHPWRVERTVETVDGQELVRFDIIYTAALRSREGVIEYQGQEFVGVAVSSDGEDLFSQVWADPKTQLPVRSQKRSFSPDGFGLTGRFVTGVYSFPETGPKDFYALGVPRDAKVVRSSYWDAGAAENDDKAD